MDMQRSRYAAEAMARADAGEPLFDAVDCALRLYDPGTGVHLDLVELETVLVVDLAGAISPAPHSHDAADVVSGTLDGDRLPALSAAKRGGVPATGVPSGKYLKDNDTWDSPGGGAGLTHPQVLARGLGA